MIDLRSENDQPTPTLTADETTSAIAVIRASRVDSPIAVELESEPFVVEPREVSQHPVEVFVLGPVRIEVNGTELKNGLRSKARELMAFLALRPQGATWEAIAAALWPEANGRQSNQRFRTTLGNLRTTLRNLSEVEGDFVDLVGERYVLDSSLIDCDVWRFQSALSGSTGEGALTSLQRVVDNYRGDLADGSYFEWVESPREDLRRRALDALGRLAELYESNGDLSGALSVLERALTVDRYMEELYRRVMRVQAASGYPEAVVRTYQLLERRLSEIDVDPDDKTMELLRRLNS